MKTNAIVAASNLFLRMALSLAFLSAVADRFGFWGSFGQPHVAWGDFQHFVAYTGKLNWFMPAFSFPLLAWLSTFLETILGLALFLGIFTRAAAFLSGALLLLFAIAMSFALGVKAPLDASVFSASAGGFLLALSNDYPWSLDFLFHHHAPDHHPSA